jgi:hypothetical protein
MPFLFAVTLENMPAVPRLTLAGWMVAFDQDIYTTSPDYAG